MATKWTMENTGGYNQQQLDTINAEWALRADREGLTLGTDEYERGYDLFEREVMQRCRAQM